MFGFKFLYILTYILYFCNNVNFLLNGIYEYVTNKPSCGCLSCTLEMFSDILNRVKMNGYSMSNYLDTMYTMICKLYLSVKVEKKSGK